jgi:hypothetical protein
MKKHWALRHWASKGLAFVVFAALAAAVFGFAVRGLWNWLLPPLFGLQAVSFEQALGLLALSWILFGGFRGRPGLFWRRRLTELTPEERAKFRAGILSRLSTPAAEPKDQT